MIIESITLNDKISYGINQQFSHNSKMENNLPTVYIFRMRYLKLGQKHIFPPITNYYTFYEVMFLILIVKCIFLELRY